MTPTLPPTELSTVREKFEHWYSDQGACPRAIERSSDGMLYVLLQAQLAWGAWLAAAEALAPALAEWEKLRNPASLHVNLLRGIPARLEPRELLHIAGYTQHEVDDALAMYRAGTPNDAER